MSDPTEPRALDRREFLQLLGAASLASVLPLAREANAQTAPPATAPVTPPAPAAPSDDARALTALLKRRYPERFSEAQWESIARDFDGDLGLGKRLRALKLKNSDEPDSTFSV